MLGGGSFTVQNKVLPGTYINFVSAANTGSALSDRGIVAVPLVLDWGPEKQVVEMSAEEFLKDNGKILGYVHDEAEMKKLREVFCHATKCLIYRLNTGVKARNDLAEARYGGIRGNDLKIAAVVNADNEALFDVVTFLDGHEVDKQTAAGMSGLKDNDYVIWKKDGSLTATAGMPLTGGTNGEEVKGEDHMAFLNAMETYAFHILCCTSADDNVKALYMEYTRRLREEAGIKFQTVMYRKHDADYEGVISIENKAAEEEQALVYWTAGAEAACAVNRTNDNMVYDGEYTVDVAYTQQQLADAVSGGRFIFHRSAKEVCVLADINTLVTFSVQKNEDFGSNQTIRVLDQIGNDIAGLFNTQFFGKMPNDASGRISLWNAVTTYMKKLAALRAIETVDTEAVTVGPGETKKSVTVTLPVTPVNCMNQLYMTVVVD